MFCRNNFVKGLLTFVIIIFGLIGTNVLSAGFSFDDFPQLAAGYDISVDYSELGKDYVKVKMNINQHENNFAYQLYYKEYDKDLNLIKSNTTNVQNLSLFHFQVSTMHFYDFCVVAYDQFGQIADNTSVERVVPGQFINRPKNRNGHVSLDHQSAKNFSTIQADDYSLNLIFLSQKTVVFKSSENLSYQRQVEEDHPELPILFLCTTILAVWEMKQLR